MTLLAARGAIRDLWALDSDVTFLNHGSFGACPRPVLEAQSELRYRLEAEPVRFMTRELGPLLAEARAGLAEFLGATAENLVFVPNATAGVNTILRSLRFSPGDELLTTNHAYRACLNALQFVAERSGARVRIVHVDTAPTSGAAVVEAVLGAVTRRTRLAMLDHVTSPTALVFPIEALVGELESRGIMVLVDAAHSPGMLPMALEAIGASFTTGNLHKWVCAPKGAGFLHVRSDRQPMIRPLAVSHRLASGPVGNNSTFQLDFDWVGTIDPTPYLCVPSALAFMAALHSQGWVGVMRSNREAAQAAADLLDRVVPQPAPPTAACAMVSLGLPGRAEDAAPLQDRLFFEHRIEVPIIPFAASRILRVSMQRYVSMDDVARLAEALPALL